MLHNFRAPRSAATLKRAWARPLILVNADFRAPRSAAALKLGSQVGIRERQHIPALLGARPH